MLKTTKKGKTVLQISVSPEAEKSTLILAAEADSELQMWQMDIDRALKWNSKEDSISLGSSSRANSIQPNSSTAADAESVTAKRATAATETLLTDETCFHSTGIWSLLKKLKALLPACYNLLINTNHPPAQPCN
uniref:PH domain-containing protein n=1 Tax=Ditylenchus dipsaci TaxID=166011 RepID=A0A915EU31_9BILA